MKIKEDQAQQLREMVKKMKAKQKGPRVITVTSGKGGVGKTSFSVNLAITLSQRGMRVLIIDADFGLANIDVMLGVQVPHDLTKLLNDNLSVNDVIVRGHAGVQFISGGSGVYDLINLSDAQLQTILGKLLHIDDLADMIIFDTGAGVNENIIRLINSSNETILVTTPEPTAIMDAYALVKAVRKSYARPMLRLMVNKAESVKEATETLQSFSRIVSKYMSIEVDSLGYVLYDPLVTRAVKQQVPLVISYPRCGAAMNIGQIADKYLENPEKQGGIAQFINRFLKRGFN